METSEAKILKVKWRLHENIAKKIIFIDGLPRCGKSMLCGIVPSLENVEHIQLYPTLEYIVPGLSLGCVDEEYAKELVRVDLNQVIYNTYISRGVNFRPADFSGVPNYRDPKLYHDRLNREDGNEVVDELRLGLRFSPFQTHAMLVSLEHLNKLEINYWMIALFRHPVDTIHSWWKRGWGERYGSDPRSFTLAIEWEGKCLPWYCAGHEEEWIRSNPMERCVQTVLHLYERSVEQYRKAISKERILTVTFENFTQHPECELPKICNFLGTKPSLDTPKFIQAARCPRVIQSEERRAKLKNIQVSIRPELFQQLLESSEGYEKDLWGLKA
jgi:hypothetical protein